MSCDRQKRRKATTTNSQKIKAHSANTVSNVQIQKHTRTLTESVYKKNWPSINLDRNWFNKMDWLIEFISVCTIDFIPYHERCACDFWRIYTSHRHTLCRETKTNKKHFTMATVSTVSIDPDSSPHWYLIIEFSVVIIVTNTPSANGSNRGLSVYTREAETQKHTDTVQCERARSRVG